MLEPRILVTGATGKTGSVVVAELLKAGYRVRAMVHREDRRSARLQAQGAEIRARSRSPSLARACYRSRGARRSERTATHTARLG